MSFSLVLCKDEPRESSVISTKDVKVVKGRFKVKWGRKYYDVDILKSHDDKEYLENFDVDQDGNISEKAESVEEDEKAILDRILRKELVSSEPGHGKILLAEGSGIYVNEVELDNIKTKYYNDGHNMVTKTMYAIIKKDELLSMTVTGRQKTVAIPSCIYTGVFKFLNENAAEDQRMLLGEYRKIITKMCSNVRNRQK